MLRCTFIQILLQWCNNRRKIIEGLSGKKKVFMLLFDFAVGSPWFFFPFAANGYTSARASPGLLTVSNGNSLGKVVLAKSPPPPPSPQMVNSRKPDLRVITSQGGKSLMQMVSHIKLNLWSHKITQKSILHLFSLKLFSKVQIALSNRQNLIEDKHCRLFVIIFWCLATMLFNISVFTLNKFEILNRPAQPHWHIGEIFAESFFNKSTHVSFELCTINGH